METRLYYLQNDCWFEKISGMKDMPKDKENWYECTADGNLVFAAGGIFVQFIGKSEQDLVRWNDERIFIKEGGYSLIAN